MIITEPTDDVSRASTADMSRPQIGLGSDNNHTQIGLDSDNNHTQIGLGSDVDHMRDTVLGYF